MKVQLWCKIQSQWDTIIQSIDVVAVSDSLMQKNALKFEDHERIKHEVTQNDKARKLLEILKFKDDKHFNSFIDALKESENTTIVNEIMKEHVPDDIHLQLGSTAEGIIQDTLEGNFEENTEGRVSFDEVFDKIKRSFRIHGECFEYNEIMIQCVKTLIKDVFPSSHVAEASPRGKQRSPSFEFIIGIWPKGTWEDRDPELAAPGVAVAQTQKKESNDDGSSWLDGKQYQDENLRMSDMTVDQICEWLSPVLKRNGIEVDKFLQIIKEEKINGKAFEHMKIEEMKDLFPDIKFGERKVILVDRDKYLNELRGKEDVYKAPRPASDAVENIAREVFRVFNTTSKAVDTYRQEAVMPEIETRVIDKIQPVHRFMQPEINIPEADQVKFIVDATIEFAAACMNERTNGTIHFGISGDKADKQSYGKVKGIPAAEPGYDKAIVTAIESKFYPDQREKALACIRPPQFIRVLGKLQKSDLFVIEVDVVPAAHVIDSEAFFIKDQDRSKLLRYTDDGPKEMDQREVEKYMKEKSQLSEDRRIRENVLLKSPKNIRKELQWFLCNGGEKMDGDIYSLVFLSPPDTTGCTEDFQFLNYIETLAVFDFDPKGTEGKLYQALEENQYIVKTTDDFDAAFVEQKSIQENLNDLKESSNLTWFFCNGHELAGKKEMNPFEWTQERSESFKKILLFFHEQIPPDRARIIFIIQSKNFEVLAEAAREVVLKFKGQWIVLAESENVVESWKAFLLEKYATCFDRQILDERCLAGMPWKTIRDTIKDFAETEIPSQCEIPTIHGGLVEIPERLRKELCDLEILGARECDNQQGAIENVEEHRRKVEEDFYRGYQVSWWNFWYKGQVLRRKQQGNISIHISEVAKGELPYDERVGCVAIYHQPGSGGTTTARQVLWDNRATYPCFVVRKITNQTCSQICKIRSYPGEENVQVPIVLVDSEDEEKLASLKKLLEDEATKSGQRIFCVLLVCYRRTLLPFEKMQKYISLKQEISNEEQHWFQQKYQDLMNKYKQKKGINPNHLINLNIMKENFNSECISHTVKEFLRELQPSEHCLLKCIALVNTYDLDFNPIPISCFDPIMIRRVYVPSRRHHHQNIGKGWDQRLGQALLVLLTLTVQPQMGRKLKSLRISNPLLSKEILSQILKNDGQTLGEAFHQFLSCPIFLLSHSGNAVLIKILQTMMKKREWDVQGKEARPKTFSPLVQTLIDSGDTNHALEIMKTTFNLTNDDPMIAQQIARLYNHLELWKEAEEYAGLACQLRPNNSFLKHTMGQICKSRLLKIYKEHMEKRSNIDQQTVLEAIDHGMRAISIFKEVQELSLRDHGSTNLGGHMGEIETCIALLDTLSLMGCFSRHSNHLHRYLVEKGFQTDMTKFIDFTRSNWLKSLGESVFNTLDDMEKDLLLMKKNVIPEQKRVLAIQSRGDILKCKADLNSYFGEDKDKIPEGFDASQQSEYRRRFVQTKCGRSFVAIINLRFHDGGDEMLQKALRYMQDNIQQNQHNNHDLVVALSSALSMKIIHPSLPHHVQFEETLKWSRQLFDGRLQEARFTREACMFLLLLHWPTPSRLRYSLCPFSLIREALQTSHSVSIKEKKYDKFLFYLSKDHGFDSVVHEKEMRGGKKGNVARAHALNRLLWLQGTLTGNGQEIITALEGPKGVKGPTVTLSTEKPVIKKTMWNKPVFFTLGFGLSGPRAMEVTDTNPTISTEVKFTYPNHSKKQQIFTNEFDLRNQQRLKIQEIESRQHQGFRLGHDERQLLTQKPQIMQRFQILWQQRMRFLQGNF